MDLSAKLLEINPELYTAWNYRKLAVEHNLSQCETDPDSFKSLLDEELGVVRFYTSNYIWHLRFYMYICFSNL